jgi:hypothetical protein
MFQFNNNQSSGTIVVRNNSATTVATIQSGGYVEIILLSNATAAGSWDVHNQAPSNVTWSTNTFDYPGSITSATWNGTAVAINRGGTGQATAQLAINALAGAVTSGSYLRGNGTNVVMNTIQAADVPTLNQSTTGSAATLTTPRAIYGNNFDGSAALTQVIASTYGGTGNGFTKFSGPTTAEKTFTLPDSNATLLYSGGALGTPASGTVTNLTGTASININGTVGATTANTGAFTTLSASGAITTTGGNITRNGSGTAAGFLNVNNTGNDSYFGINNSAGTTFAASAYDTVVQASAGNAVSLSVAGTGAIARATSTGLAVTGALTTSGKATIGASTTAYGYGENLVIGAVSAPKILWAQSGGYRWSAYLDSTNADWHLRYEEGSSDILNVNRSGNVGIGTSSPSQKLEVNGSVQIPLSSAYYLYTTNYGIGTGTGLEIFTGSGDVMRFITGGKSGTERARIDSSGTLLVGTTTANSGAANGFGAVQTADATYCFTNHASGTAAYSWYHSFGYATSQIGYIYQSGTTAVVYSTTSDYRRKSNVKDLTGSGTFIDALKPRTFDWDTGDKGVGFIAHEFAEVSPMSVCGEKDGVDADGKPIYQAMQASSAEVIANLVAELQSVRQRLAALESK